MFSPPTHTRISDLLLAELAKSYGVLTRYRDSRGAWQECSPRSIYQALMALGAHLDNEQVLQAGGAGAGRGQRKQEGALQRALERAVELRKRALWDRMIDPVVVCWDGALGRTRFRLPSGDAGAVELTLLLEDGSEHSWKVPAHAVRPAGGERAGGRDYTEWWLSRVPKTMCIGPEGLAPGYHRLRLRAGRREAEATLISAPRCCWSPPAGSSPARRWGVFTPLYALRSDRDWGAGDLSDLAELGDEVAAAGGRAVATLPLLAAYLDEPFEPAPYRPVSRLFWNEFYLAPEQTAEWSACAAARRFRQAPATQERLEALRAAGAVDYRDVMALKRKALEELSACFFESAGDERRGQFAAYLTTHPHATAYAAFRSKLETGGEDATAGYHLFCQWQMDEQLARFAKDGGGAGGPGRAGLFLDVPVGVHPHGFDTSHWRDTFVSSLSIGAPPDAFFALGQKWQTPPLHPERQREQGYRYLVDYLREQMRHAAYLRIDHFMGLHRLYCIPEGCEAKEGVYVTYPAEEQYAVLSLESHRNRTVVVGEDLGTVPPETRRGMRDHGVLGTWVMQLAVRSRAAEPVQAPPSSVIAAVNTHDTFPFAGFVAGDDVAARERTGQVDAKGARREIAARHALVAKLEAWLPPVAHSIEAGSPEVALLTRALAYLARSGAAFVLVNLEDLWGEKRPQNQPGTGAEHGNWERKLAASGQQVRQAVQWVARVMR